MQKKRASRSTCGVIWPWAAIAIFGLSGGCSPKSAAEQAEFAQRTLGTGKVLRIGDAADDAHAQTWRKRSVRVSDLPGLKEAEQQNNADHFAMILQQHGISWVFAKNCATSVSAAQEPNQFKLCQKHSLNRIRGEYFSEFGSLYRLHEPTRESNESTKKALLLVTRKILEGANPPQLTSFPAELQNAQATEVMVVLKRNNTPVLWRSSRAGSFARALLQAASVAKERWDERHTTLGGKLSDALVDLTLEIYVLEDDGTLGSRNPTFVDQFISADHGVAFERKGAWYYSLPGFPRETRVKQPSARYQELFEKYGFRGDIFKRQDLRLYRLRCYVFASESSSS